MRIYLKDITNETYLEREIPCEDLKLNPNHEYIICDGDLDCGEFYDIKKLNEFLSETELSVDGIKILNTTFLFDEIVEMTEPIIINFDNECSTWNYGNGLNPTEDNYGLIMHSLGYNMLPCEIPEELIDYINWEHNWTALESIGWRATSYDGVTYLVHR